MGVQNVDMMKKILQAKNTGNQVKPNAIKEQNKSEGTGKPSIFSANSNFGTQSQGASASIFTKMNAANSTQQANQPHKPASPQSIDPTKDAEKMHSMNPEDILKKLKSLMGLS